MRAGGRRSGDFANLDDGPGADGPGPGVAGPGGAGPGDAGPGAAGSLAAQRLLADAPWTWLHQVHGKRVVVVDRPGACRSEEADAAVTACAGAALVVRTADCAPVGLASPEGVVGVAHAGWRGLMAGVVEEAVAAMRSLGAGDVVAALGPCIAAHAYRFSKADLEQVAARYGDGVVAVDEAGYPALDLTETVRAALGVADAALVADAGVCTHCSVDHWSWRAKRDRRRQATVVWRPVPPAISG